jgi:myo-inositol-1-phosphate synthase
VPWLTDRKWAHIRLEGQAFGDVPLQAELKLEVWDSPNSAGIVTDAVRCCKLALNHGVAGQLDGPSSYLMKSPHNQRPDDQAREETEKFIETYSRLTKAAQQARAGEDAAAEERASA